MPDLTGVGAVIVEPVQGRGGVRVPPKGWLEGLREACDQAGAVLIFDEIYTGFGRTGSLFAFQDSVRPDLLCLGKGMAGGYPISACIRTRRVMEAWGASRGEALHTQTFLGNPVGSAMALACIDLVVSGELHARAEEYGDWARRRLSRHGVVRGRGLLLGLEVDDALGLSRALFERGWIALPAGERAEVLCLTPPLTIPGQVWEGFFDTLDELLA